MTDWTLATLFDYFSSLQVERDKRFDERFASQNQAILKAEESTEKRLAGLNEIRKAMADQQSTYITRVEANAKLQSLSDKLDLLTTRLDKSEGKGAGLQAGWGYILGAIGGVIGLSGIFAFLVSILK